MISAAEESERPRGVTIIALALLLASAYLLTLAVLIGARRVSLVRGAYLLEGLELRGAVVFVAVGLLSSAVGIGLLGHRDWARRLTCVLAAALLIGAVPTVSSAVVDFRFWTLLREGLKIVCSVAVCFYLSQPETRAAFGRRVSARILTD
jgi:hypothetical protein